MSSSSRRKVLVVDDDLPLLELMRLAFEREGLDVRAAPDGDAAIVAFRRNPADLLVTDIIMPAAEGLETILALKRMAPALKVVAISGGGRMGAGECLTLARHIGADATLQKPFGMRTLVELALPLLGDRREASL